jgi:hypothetical protein
VVQREPEWLDSDRQQALALAAWRQNRLCPCGCGHLAVDTLVDTDATTGPAWDVHERTCTVRAALDMRRRDIRVGAMPAADRPKGYRFNAPEATDGLVLWAQKPHDGGDLAP